MNQMIKNKTFSTTLLASSILLLSACGGGNNDSSGNADRPIPGDLANECGRIYGIELNSVFSSDGIEKRFNNESGEFEWQTAKLDMDISVGNLRSFFRGSLSDDADAVLCDDILGKNLSNAGDNWEGETDDLPGIRVNGQPINYVPVLDIRLTKPTYNTIQEWIDDGEPSSKPAQVLDSSKLTFRYFTFDSTASRWQLEDNVVEETSPITLNCENDFELHYKLEMHQTRPANVDPNMCEYNNMEDRYECLVADVSEDINHCSFVVEQAFILDNTNQKIPVSLSGYIDQNAESEDSDDRFVMTVRGIEFL